MPEASTDARGPVVFLVLTHNRPAMAERLLHRLAESERAITVLHHDPSSPGAAPRLPPGGRALAVPTPRAVEWGRISVVEAIIHGLRWAREQIPDLSWFVPLSGQDYPVTSVRAIEAALLESRSDVFMRWEFIPPFARRRSTDWQRGMSHRYYWHYFPGRLRPIPVPRLRFYFDGVGVFAGSTWSMLGRRALDRIHDDVDLAYLRHRFEQTNCPDEALFQTALMNSPLGLRVTNSDRRFYDFPKTGGSAHPRVLTVADLDAVVASGALFARKVEEEASAELLDRLDERAASAAPVDPV